MPDELTIIIEIFSRIVKTGNNPYNLSHLLRRGSGSHLGRYVARNVHSVILSLAYEVTPFLPSRWTGTLSGNLTKMAERKWSPVGSKSAGLWFLRACLGLESRRGIIGPGDRPLEPPPPGGTRGDQGTGPATAHWACDGKGTRAGRVGEMKTSYC